MTDAVLVADDDAVTRELLSGHLQNAGFSVLLASDGEEAMARLSADIAVALFDLQMPKATGFECLRFAQEKFPDVQVMVISQSSEIRDGIEAMKQGAVEYITKPADPEELVARVRQAIRSANLAQENRQLRQAMGGPMPTITMTGKSTATQKLREQVAKIAGIDSTVLITGQSGTGKSTLARLIHQEGPRAQKPFVTVSCASLPRDLIEAELFGHVRGAFTGAVGDRPGRAEMADSGTLFLDEIGDMPMELQPKLLTFLQERTLQRIGDTRVRKVDVRVIAATLQDLDEQCRLGTFREDLYFRLNVLPLHLPPLQERSEDIEEFAEYLLGRIAAKRGCQPLALSEDAMQALLEYDWPGNIREVENVLERASAFCESLTLQRSDLTFSAAGERRKEEGGKEMGEGGVTDAFCSEIPSLAGLKLRDIEKRLILDTLRACGGNKKETARQLGIDEKTVHNKIKRFGLTDLS